MSRRPYLFLVTKRNTEALIKNEKEPNTLKSMNQFLTLTPSTRKNMCRNSQENQVTATHSTAQSTFPPHDAAGNIYPAYNQGTNSINCTSFASSPVSNRSTTYNSPQLNLLARWIMDGDYLNVITLIERDPERARTRIVAHDFMGGSGVSQVLPIHMALSLGVDVPMELIQTLLVAYPNSIWKTETGYKRNCAHIALKSSVPDSIISYLIQLHPKACEQQDRLGRLPLHYAISNIRSFEITHEILTKYPEAVKAWDHLGWTPLHIACQTYSSLDVFKELISRYSEAVLMTTKRGSTPLSLATNSKTNYKEFIVPILEKVDAAYRQLPLIQNYRAAVAKKIYQAHHYIPPVCHRIV